MKCVFEVKKKALNGLAMGVKKKDFGKDFILADRVLKTDFDTLIFHVGKGKGFC